MPALRSSHRNVSHQRPSRYLLLPAIFLPALLLGLFIYCQSAEPPDTALQAGSLDSFSSPSDEEVFSRLSILLGSNDTELVSIQYLSPAEVSSLAGSQPVLYGDLTGPLYKVTLKQEGKLLLILYDFNSNIMLKQFMVREVHLN